MRISAKSQICLIIGDPVERSLSPDMHNAAYEKLKIDDQFVFAAAKVSKVDTKKAVQAMRAMNIRGMTCTMPHKLAVMQFLDAIDPVAEKIGAVNTIVNEHGELTGYNTDWLGVVKPLEKEGNLKGKTIAIIGAGGAARAAIFGLIKREAEVIIFNRTLERAEKLANEFGGKAYGLKDLERVRNMDIIFNATSISNESFIPKEYLLKNHIVFDALYYPYETQLLKDAKEQGATIIHGTEMLLHQGLGQFALYTGQTAPEETMRKVIMENIATN